MENLETAVTYNLGTGEEYYRRTEALVAEVLTYTSLLFGPLMERFPAAGDSAASKQFCLQLLMLGAWQ